MTSFCFEPPVRCIFEDQDLAAFRSSPAHDDIYRFVEVCSNEIRSCPINTSSSDLGEPSEIITQLAEFLSDLETWIDEIPPEAQPMRYGNKAFRKWHDRLVQEAPLFVSQLVEGRVPGAAVEVAPYLIDSFGSPARIDYGTGHETNMLLFFYCLFKLGLLPQEQLRPLLLVVFSAYIRLMRRLQSAYLLEPAGTHGVWGLDDYHCLLFVFGSSQLIDNAHDISPADIHDEAVLQRYSATYFYLEGIQTIRRIKSRAPFFETSPMLNDISQLATWKAIHSGLKKLYLGEVLGKRPVVQHMLFGSLLPCNWTPHPPKSVTAPPENVNNAMFREATVAPWAMNKDKK